MNKFKDWARWLRPDVEHHEAQEIADYLESLATLADEAPKSYSHQGRFAVDDRSGITCDWVTKEYAAYYQAKCAVLSGELATMKNKMEMQSRAECENRQHLLDQLAAAQRRIAALVALTPVNIEAEQPKPVMALLQFDALIGLIQSISYEQTLPFPLMPDSHKEYYIARKALCGE